ncbi:hypothetical protein K0C01_05660 [Salinarchaeum sp. IM2453]|nr:hypothetical protein [Salinarchaeum sp. IM2453]QZA89612.1 hypothetical protein K0C01_05660 [Salinarchaeum sp. IM2453]
MHPELTIAKTVVMLLSGVIAVHAYRSYRRMGGTAMLYVAVGFSLVSVAALVEGMLYELGIFSLHQASAIQTSITAIGIGFVLYSLYGGSMSVDIPAQRDD